MLSLLAATAEDQPLACVVDDAQWLDRASVQCLAFAARRLLAEPIALIFAVREPGDDQELAGMPGLTITGLGLDDARTLLATAVSGRVDAEVRDRIVAETGGNPLALLQLPPADWVQASWRAVSGCPTRGRWPAASRAAFTGSSGRFRARHSGCC